MHSLGVDIGGTKVALGVIDADGAIIERREYPTPGSPTGIDEVIVAAYRELAERHAIVSMGLAVPGLVSSDRETVMFAPNVNYRNYPIAARIRTLIDDEVPVLVENDANAAGWAEYALGAGDGRDMLMLTIGTGVGGAVVLGGQVLRGAHGAGAEVGHLQIVDGGLTCGCGQQGCFEAYASGTALERMAREAVGRGSAASARLQAIAAVDGAVRGKHVALAAAEGDTLSLDLLDRLGEWIGRGAASLAAVLDPAVIVIGGGVSTVGDPLFTGIRRGFSRHLTGGENRPVAPIIPAAFGNEAGILGAADLARAAANAAPALAR
ncbi:ROK family glucokinase [Demequina sp. SYSU T00192]|uniref:Glucokinase n=1 Tax=Demequina litoralis TaxID=3051660 RepID=A0ABT8GAC4_9MICO|nr:ROK family glucokinase [Demequina sp. SYSU T00192]MDN4476087.1 ROK family glucokinase [Demequina sp. SYSU T00192]